MSPPKTENFQIKNSDSAQNIDCGYSIEPPVFSSKNNKSNVYPCKPSFTYKRGVLVGQNYIGIIS